MEITKKNKYFSKVYKLVKNKEKNNQFVLKDIFSHKNKKTEVITSIHPINISHLNKNIIFITSSQSSQLEIVNKEI